MNYIFKTLEAADKAATLALNSVSCPLTDVMWRLLSNEEIWYVFYALVAVLFIRRLGWEKGGLSILAIVLTVVASDQLANFTKEFFHRLRPCWDSEMIAGGLRILEDLGGQYGFFSAHAANTAGFAVCSYLCFDKFSRFSYATYGELVVIWAFLVGMSRVFVGKHFLGDVIVGFAVGTLFAWLFASIISRLWIRTLRHLARNRQGR